jgi:hypothetical protein
MILWALLSVGLALLLAAAILAVAMLRAERRARRRLYRALGLADEAVELLMARSADVLTEISLLRMSPTTREAAVPPIEALPEGDHESLARQEPAPRLQPATRPQRAADGRVSAATRRLPYSGRHRRP